MSSTPTRPLFNLVNEILLARFQICFFNFIQEPMSNKIHFLYKASEKKLQHFSTAAMFITSEV